MISVAAGFYLRGFGAIFSDVVIMDATDELKKRSTCGTAGRDVRRAKAVGGQAAKMPCPFEDCDGVTPTRGRNRRHDSPRRSAHHHDIKWTASSSRHRLAALLDLPSCSRDSASRSTNQYDEQ